MAIRTLLVLGVIGALGLGSYAIAGEGSKKVKGDLSGYEEVPALSTLGSGEFRARIDGDEIRWTLSYGSLESNVTQAHIHFGNVSVNGGISVFLCTNLGNGPAGTQACPVTGGTISGTIHPADVSPAGLGAVTAPAQGIAAGEFDELVAAIRAASTYANVHTVGRPGGEIRAQLNARHGFAFDFGHGDSDEGDDD
jgi:hypothetical protein